MSAVTASWTLSQLEQITERGLAERVLRETGLGQYGTATGNGGANANIVDTSRLLSTQYNADMWTGAWAWITRDAGGAGAAPEGEIHAITSYTPSSGTLVTDQVFTAGVASGDSYQLWRFPNPRDVKDIITSLLTEELYFPCWTVLTECPDGDMEQNNTTDWTASNTTIGKNTSAPEGAGKRWMSVLTTAANGYCRSALLRVEPGRTYHVSAMVRASAAATTAKLIFHDETNDAAITPEAASALTSTRLYWHRIGSSFTVPSTCYTASIRLSNVEDAVTTYWDEVAFYPIGARDIALPWWMKSVAQLVGTYKSERRMASPSVSYTADAQFSGTLTGNWNANLERFGKGQGRLVSETEMLDSRPLFILGKRNETAFSDENTDYKHVNMELAVAAVAAKCFTLLATHPLASSFDADWLKEGAAKWGARFEALKYAAENELRQRDQSPPPDEAWYTTRSYSRGRR